MFSDIGTALPIFVGTLTDTTVYPPSNYKYKTNMVFWSGNKFFGDTVGAQQIFLTSYDPNVDNKYVDSGTYIPSLVASTNVTTVVFSLCHFSIKDRICTLSGRVTITPTALLSTSVQFSPPIPSQLDLLSTTASTAGMLVSTIPVDVTGVVTADVTAPNENTIMLAFTAVNTLSSEFRYICQYPIW
jgi:hypothetical protein